MALRLHVKQGPLYVQVEAVVKSMVLMLLLTGPKPSGHRRRIAAILFSYCDWHYYDWIAIKIHPLIDLDILWQDVNVNVHLSAN